MDMDYSEISRENNRKILSVKLLVISGIVLIILGIGGFSILLSRQPANTLPLPVSSQIANKLSFNIYYPNQKLLPEGYFLDKSSFTVTNQVLIFSVSNSYNQQLIFSDQAKPSNSIIEEFYTRNIPLNTTLSTDIGLATIGAINTRTIVSIPTDTNTWIIVTAPGNISQENLIQVLRSIELAERPRFSIP